MVVFVDVVAEEVAGVVVCTQQRRTGQANLMALVSDWLKFARKLPLGLEAAVDFIEEVHAGC